MAKVLFRMRSRMRRKNRAMILLLVPSIVLTLLAGLVWASWDETEGLRVSQKVLPEVNCLQNWTGVQDQNHGVKSIQLRRCDEALGIR